MHDRGDEIPETGSQMQLFEVEAISEIKVPPKPGKKQKIPYRAGNMYLVASDEISVNTEQPRRFFNDADLQTLAESILSHGLLQPVLCQVKENRLHLLAGERRLRAAELAGLPQIPVRIVTGDPLEIALIENLLRTDLTAVEEAEAIAALKEKKGYRLEDLAGITGKAVPTLSEILAVTRLPAEILDECRCVPSVPRDILVMIARLPGKEEMIASFEQYRNGSLNREGLAARARTLKKARVKKPAPFTYIRSITKRFARFDIAAMNSNEREKFRSELKKLMDSIVQTLDTLE